MNDNDLLHILRDPATIRLKSKRIYEAVLSNESDYFTLDLSKLQHASDMLIQLINQAYPDLEVPFHSRWRHFEVGHIDRLTKLKNHPLFPTETIEQSRCFIELVFVSVLLDAGAGNDWSYLEADSEKRYNRSEGLAIASLDMYQSGLFSSPDTPFSIHANTLRALSVESLANALQVSNNNPLSGLSGRLSLLHRLADVLDKHETIFKKEKRLGYFFDYLLALSSNNSLDASSVFSEVLTLFSSIWPSRLILSGENLGDVWCYHRIPNDEDKTNWIPFHKLSQWLTYSLLEPFQWQGISITGLEKLTGLPEYRNGGFFIDMGVIQCKDRQLQEKPYSPDHDAIIEWRALTVILLDAVWELVCNTLCFSKESFPLVKLLEAGTWKAGRIEAKKRRPSGAPPIQIISDGTVF